jgi:hypothetical protein
MNNLTDVFTSLEAFFEKIVVTEDWETDESSSILGDDLEPIIDRRILLFNGLSSGALRNKLEILLNEVHLTFSNKTEIKNSDKIITDSHLTFFQNLIHKIETKSIFKIEFNKGKANEGDWEVIERHFSPIILTIRNQMEHIQNTDKSQSFIPKGNMPLRWNENINKLVDIFYQLTKEIKTKDNVTIVETKPLNLAYFIVNNFVDANGEPFNFDTVQTCLKPGKLLKRPTGDNRIIIKYIS